MFLERVTALYQAHGITKNKLLTDLRLDLHRPEEIMEQCQIPRPAAEYRARRMAVLYRRQRFLTSPLERRLHRQFQPYLARTVPACCPSGG